jgi:tetratricopeptide (TPR) repeat protein
MALVRASLSSAVLQAGKLEEASEILDRAWQHLGEEGGLLAKSLILNGRGMVALRQKRYQDAETLFRDELSAVESMSRTKIDGRIAISLNNIGVAIREQNRPLEAEPFARRAIEVGESAFGPCHFHPANAMKNLAQTYAMLGRVSEAVDLYQAAIARFEKSERATGPVTAKMAETRQLLAQLEGR